MTLNVIGSNSLGNCYVLQNESEALVIECGLDIQNVLKSVGFNLRKIVGAVVTHRHNDHAGHIRKYADSGIVTLALADTLRCHGLEGHPFSKEITSGKAYKVGGFVCQPFDVHHDAPCVGWLIKHPDIGKLLFATDTTHVDYRFRDLRHIMIEANYIDGIVDRRCAEGDEHMIRSRGRLLKSHMEFEATKAFLRNQDMSKVETVTLIHLSDGNSDEERMVREVRQLTGVRTEAAQKGLTINLSY